ncbi:hypothetical protein N7504_004814 [Penicillium tannophilum]|nr:hypothetical protein N7504_004814 [Penicillium tannophilum]
MLLIHLVLSTLSFASLSHAIVTFYGSKAVRVPMSLASSRIKRTQTLHTSFPFSFHLDTELSCADPTSRTIAFNCDDLAGNATCFENGHDTSATTSRRSQSLKARDRGPRCDEYTGQCRNEYQSTSGFCTGDYKREAYIVKGYSSDIRCSKPCTQEEKSTCLKARCTAARRKCGERGSSLSTCIDALVECRDGDPVKMDASRCKADYITGGLFKLWCDDEGVNSPRYENGACSIDESTWEKYSSWVTLLALPQANFGRYLA